jgi:hypothetical protein
MDSAEGAALIAASLLSVPVFPLTGLTLLGRAAPASGPPAKPA